MTRARAGRLRVPRFSTVVLVGLLCTGAAFAAFGAYIPIKAEVAQWLLGRAWTAAENGRRDARPWPWADTRPVARLRLPGVREPLIVLAGASGRNLAFGPVHVEGSASPGAEGVAVIAGHRDTHFSALRGLRIGDLIEVDQPGGESHRFEVAAIDVVDVDRATIRLDAGAAAVVLVTCYPFDAAVPGGPLRYVVTAVRVGPET